MSTKILKEGKIQLRESRWFLECNKCGCQFTLTLPEQPLDRWRGVRHLRKIVECPQDGCNHWVAYPEVPNCTLVDGMVVDIHLWCDYPFDGTYNQALSEAENARKKEQEIKMCDAVAERWGGE